MLSGAISTWKPLGKKADPRVSAEMLGTNIGFSSDTARRRIWGASAPDLSLPPLVIRPLEDKVVSATLYRLGNPFVKNVTGFFKAYLADKRNNQLDRPDVFHSLVNDFLYFEDRGECDDNARLFVTYKIGMRVFAVIYSQDIVFPPSEPPKEKRPSRFTQETTALYGFENVTPLIKQLAGPCEDFYIGSTYLSTHVENVNYLNTIFPLQDRGLEIINLGTN